MLSEPVIDRQVAGQPAVPFIGVLVRHGVGPLPTQRQDEPLSLAVGPGRVGPGADDADHGLVDRTSTRNGLTPPCH